MHIVVIGVILLLSACSSTQTSVSSPKVHLTEQKTLPTTKTAFIDQQELQLAIEQSRHLVRVTTIVDKLLSASPDNPKYLTKSIRLKERVNALNQQLIRYSQENIRQGLWDNAEQSINAVKALGTPPQLISLEKQLYHYQQNRQTEQLRTINTQQQRFKNKQLNALSQATKEQRWADIYTLLETLRPWYHIDPILSAQLDIAHQQVTCRIQQLTEQGQHHYTHGALDSAIKTWQQVLELSPESHDIRERLQRAQRFKKNYEALL